MVPADRDRDEEESEKIPDLAVALIEHLIATGGQRAGVPIELEGMKFFVCVQRLDE